MEAGFPLAIGYGLTESSPLLAGAGVGKTRFLSTGTPVVGVQVRIDNPDPQTGRGEIQAKGDNIMLGYYKEPEKLNKFSQIQRIELQTFPFEKTPTLKIKRFIYSI